MDEFGRARKIVSGSLVVLFYNTLPSPKFVHSDNFGELLLTILVNFFYGPVVLYLVLYFRIIF